MTPKGAVPFTLEEEAARDAEEQAWTAGANGRIAEANRTERDALLAETDWTQMPDSALTDEAKALWVAYRTALRDITSHANWPNLADSDWPTKP